MPVRCTFALNSKETFTLICEGFGTVEAFSGQKRGRDSPDEIATPNIGPIPPGTYYLVDRQSGGLMGWAYEAAGHYFGVTSARHKWFTLWNPMTGDTTMVYGVTRGNFRLHPVGPAGLSQGCITLVNPGEFEYLERFIRRSPPTIPVPGTNLKAYGTVEVR